MENGRGKTTQKGRGKGNTFLAEGYEVKMKQKNRCYLSEN